MTTTRANEAHSVDAPIAFVSAIVHPGRRATDARRSDQQHER